MPLLHISLRVGEHLAGRTGRVRTPYVARRAVLLNVRRAHLLVDYTRNQDDGSVGSRHHNLWVVTRDWGRWGIEQRPN